VVLGKNLLATKGFRLGATSTTGIGPSAAILLTCGPESMRAPTVDKPVTFERNVSRIVLTIGSMVLLAPVVTVAMIICHECGHTVAAWLMGNWHAYFLPYQRVVSASGNVNTCIGCNLYNSAAMGPLANTFVNMAGVGATGLASWAAIVALAQKNGRWWLPSWVLIEVSLICWLGDAVWQVVQAIPLGVPRSEPVGWGIGYTDFSAAGSFFAQATGWPRPLIEDLGIAAIVAYSVITVGALGLAWRGRPARM
jgi:hypothetical protein